MPFGRLGPRLGLLGWALGVLGLVLVWPEVVLRFNVELNVRDCVALRAVLKYFGQVWAACGTSRHRLGVCSPY